MSILPDWNIIKHFQDLPPWARALVFFVVNALATVLAAPLIASVGVRPYFVFLIAVVIISFVLLFVKPKQAMKTTHVGEERKVYVRSEPSKTQTKALEAQQKKRREDLLHKLTREEKEFLAPYIFQDVTSQYTDVMGGIFQSLFKKQIVDPPASVGYMTYRDVLIQDWAKDYLIAHLELLKGFENVLPRTKPRWH